MSATPVIYDGIDWYMGDLTSRIVAESGNPDHRFHIGKCIYRGLSDAPEYILQIDGDTGTKENFASVLRRSIVCAVGLRKLGIGHTDVIVFIAPNHLDICVPFYAALFNGSIVSPVERSSGIKELVHHFKTVNPKLIFCQSEKVSDVEAALHTLEMKTKIITFDKSPAKVFEEFMQENDTPEALADFRVADFNPTESLAFLIPTSGTTGESKVTAVTHKCVMIGFPKWWVSFETFPVPTRLMLMWSPLQWISAITILCMSPILRFTRLQTPQPITVDLGVKLINQYKPTYTVWSPTFLSTLVRTREQYPCDLSCFTHLLIGGAAIIQESLDFIQDHYPSIKFILAYGLTEVVGIALLSGFYKGKTNWLKCPSLKQKLVDPVTGEDINKSNVQGELWLKSPHALKCYYNNPKASSEVLTEDGWLKTGDLFQIDDNEQYIFTDRLKLMMKYNCLQLSAVEVENVIRRHPAVLDAAVAGIPHPEHGDLPAACVVIRDGYHVTAQEIKDLVKDSLADWKQLRGGVVFAKNLPLTPTTKVHRKKLLQLLLSQHRE